jgi:hypothetical protein
MVRRLAVPLASGIAFVLTAAKTVQGGDSGELAAVASAGGVAHPPGYPLFVLWCQLWSWLPAASPTHRIALATAILGALAVFMLQEAAVAWGVSALGAALAAAIFAATPLTWRLSSEPEVFMLNALIALTIVRIAASPRAVPLALLAGLGIANHHTSIFLAPIGLWAWAKAFRASDQRGKTVLLSLVAFAVGLSPYLYLMHAAGSACAWGDTSTIGGLLHHFLRRDYGTTQLAASTDKPEPLAQLAWLGHTFLESGIAFTLAGSAAIAIKRRRFSWDHAALVLSLLLAGPVFAMRFNLPPRWLLGQVVIRFHLLPLALASVLGGYAIDAVLARLQNALVRRVAIGAGFLAIAARAASSGLEVTAHHRPTTERYLTNVLGMVPPNSIVIAVGDDLVGGFEYMQCELGKRPDVVAVSPQLLLSEWYGRRISNAVGAPIEHGVTPPGHTVPTLNGTKVVEDLVRTGRPVFITKWFLPNLETQFPSYPIGPLIRIAPPPPPDVLERMNDEVFAQLVLDETPPVVHTWAGARYVEYGRTWAALAAAYDKQGDHDAAARCRAKAMTLMPRAASPE